MKTTEGLRTMTTGSLNTPPTLITSRPQKRRRIVAWVVLIVIVLSLIASFFAEPTSTSDSGQGDITIGLSKLVQIIITFIGSLASIAELTGINIRELFISRSAETNVEDFPFYVIRDFDQVLQYLFPDPKTPLLADSKIKYLPQISNETDQAFREKGMLLIRGRSKTGKTREASELLRRWWYSGPTVLVVRSHVGLYPPFKIPENLPTKNLVIFFDDIDRYLGDSTTLKRLDETIEFFQSICHGQGELKVIATSRQEDEFWGKLQFNKTQSPWNKFELIQLNPLTTEKAQDVIVELSKMSQIEIEPSFVKTLAEKNDGTFLNLALAFRHWLSQDIKTITFEHIRIFEGVLKNTWRQRYESLAKSHPEVKPVYAAIDLMQSHNIPLQPKLIVELATEMAMGKATLSFLGLFNRFENWVDMSSLFNWYRDAKLRRRGWLIISILIFLLIYLGLYSFLTFTSGMTQSQFFDRLANVFSFQFVVLIPLWLLLIPFALQLIFKIIYNIGFRKTNRTLEYLLATEVPMRENGLRPYEGQFEGNGETNNWGIQNYTGKVSEKVFQRRASQRLLDCYINLAEALRLAGEPSGARELTNLANILSKEHPAPFFIMGKIALDEKDFENAILHFSQSKALYQASSNAARVLEMEAVCYLLLNDYDNAEKTANKSLQQMPSLVNARWISGLSKLRKEDINGRTIDYKIASASKEIPLIEIQYKIETTFSMGKDRHENDAPSTFLSQEDLRKRKEKQLNISATAFSFIFIVSILFLSLVYYFREAYKQDRLSFGVAQALVWAFPKSPSIISFRGYIYYKNNEYENAIVDFTEAIAMDPEYVETYTNRGTAYSKLEQYTKAIIDYNEAIRIDPQYVRAYHGRCQAYFDLGEYEKSFVDCNELIQISPQYVDAYHLRGLLYYIFGDYKKSIADFDETIRIEPDNPQNSVTYKTRGDVYLKLGDYEKAIADYSEAIRLDPEFAYAYAGRGNAYSALGEYDKANADFKRYEELTANP